MFRNRYLYSEGIKYLQEALELEKESDYTLNRLASSIKEKNEELVKISTIAKNAKAEIFKSEYDDNLLNTLL